MTAPLLIVVIATFSETRTDGHYGSKKSPIPTEDLHAHDKAMEAFPPGVAIELQPRHALAPYQGQVICS
jgi:hypothetical protein